LGLSIEIPITNRIMPPMESGAEIDRANVDGSAKVIPAPMAMQNHPAIMAFNLLLCKISSPSAILPRGDYVSWLLK
jgi:hypothetical protein